MCVQQSRMWFSSNVITHSKHARKTLFIQSKTCTNTTSPERGVVKSAVVTSLRVTGGNIKHLCPFLQHIWPHRCSESTPCLLSRFCESAAIHPLTLLSRRGVRKRCGIEGHSKSSSYSYSSRSRLQCGLGISKKCLFVRPSSLEMCCPKGLKGLSYLNTHRGQRSVTRSLKHSVLKDKHVKEIVWHLENVFICFLAES